MKLPREIVNELFQFTIENLNLNKFYNEEDLRIKLCNYITENTKWKCLPEYSLRYRKKHRKVDIALYVNDPSNINGLIELKYGRFLVDRIIDDYKKLNYTRKPIPKILYGIFNQIIDFEKIKELSNKTKSKFIAIMLLVGGIKNFQATHLSGPIGKRSIYYAVNKKDVIEKGDKLPNFIIKGPTLLINFEIYRYKLRKNVEKHIEKIPIMRIPNIIRGLGGKTKKYWLRTPIENVLSTVPLNRDRLVLFHGCINLEYVD